MIKHAGDVVSAAPPGGAVWDCQFSAEREKVQGEEFSHGIFDRFLSYTFCSNIRVLMYIALYFRLTRMK